MSSGRCLFLLFFATLITISMERPTGPVPKTEEKVNAKQQKLPSNEKKQGDLGNIKLTEEQEESNGVNQVLDYDNSPSPPSPVDHWQHIIRDEDEFDSKISDRIHPLTPTQTGKRFNCHKTLPSSIPRGYNCHLQFILKDYSEYDNFIKTNGTFIPSISKSVDRIVDTNNPCYALFTDHNGKMRISCGCNRTTKCQELPGIAAEMASLLQWKVARPVAREKTGGERVTHFLGEYKFLIMSAFFALILIIVLSAVAYIEWKAVKESEKKRNQRILSLSQRVEQSRSSLRSTLSEPSEPSKTSIREEDGAFHRLIKKR